MISLSYVLYWLKNKQTKKSFILKRTTEEKKNKILRQKVRTWTLISEFYFF